MNFSIDALIWMLAAEILLFFYMLLFRSRQIIVALALVFIAAFFFILPRSQWWIPAIAVALWLLLLPTARLRAIAIPTKRRWQAYLWMLIPSLPLAIWVFILMQRSDRFLSLPGNILIGVCILGFLPLVFSNALLYLICPLFVHYKEDCNARWTSHESKAMHKSVIWYVCFGNDNRKYRTGLPFYFWVKRRPGFVSYKKHYCPLGISWISHCK